jgi:hypothetical protein
MTLSMFAHRTGSIISTARANIDLLRLMIEEKDLSRAQEICERLEQELGRMFVETREFRALGYRTVAAQC